MFMQRRSQLDESEKRAYFVSWCVVGGPSRNSVRFSKHFGENGWFRVFWFLTSTVLHWNAIKSKLYNINYQCLKWTTFVKRLVAKLTSWQNAFPGKVDNLCLCYRLLSAARQDAIHDLHGYNTLNSTPMQLDTYPISNTTTFNVLSSIWKNNMSPRFERSDNMSPRFERTTCPLDFKGKNQLPLGTNNYLKVYKWNIDWAQFYAMP